MPLTLAQALQKLDWSKKRCKFAWAKYYETLNQAHDTDHAQHRAITRVVSEDAIPAHIKAELKEMALTLKKKWDCPICLEFIPDGTLEITNCGHYYCKPCLTQLQASEKALMA
jgi:hypothetical protein